MIIRTNFFSVLIIVLCILSSSSYASWSLDLESGLAFNGYNDVRIPGNTGSSLSLTDDLKSKESTFWRLRLSKFLGQKHQITLLVAPLRINAKGSVSRDIEFNGEMFEAGVQIESRYRFDSYRITYKYILHRSDKLSLSLGITGKIRDASIKIKSDSNTSENTNTGFVPLINFSIDWRLNSKFGLLVDGDALAAPQGRAEDVLLALYGNLNDNFRVRIGYRVLEGGADNDEVYNFTLVNYLSIGFTYIIK